MAYDGWVVYNDVELVNHARTFRLARALGIGPVAITEESVLWLESRLRGYGFGEGPFGYGPFGGSTDPDGYSDVTTAPWYDAGSPESAEFAGLIALRWGGLEDSSLESEVIEYITDGGNTANQRNATLPIVASVAVVASSQRGAEFGKRWLNQVLRTTGRRVFAIGSDFRYFRYAKDDAPMAHRRDVRLTRGSSITAKRDRSCSSIWLFTFTLTANDPFEYGELDHKISSLGGAVATGPDVTSYGSTVLVETSCPTFDYTPIYDPLYPALVPSPTAPDFFPAGWDIFDGMTFERHWARITPVEPTSLAVVPLIQLVSTVAARMVRVAIWPSDSTVSDQCGPLFSAVVTYLPAGVQFYIDGEQNASYVWDGYSDAVRRTDSLVYSPDAKPVQWTSFNDGAGLLVTLDAFTDSFGYEGDGEIRVSLALVPKSD